MAFNTPSMPAIVEPQQPTPAQQPVGSKPRQKPRPTFMGTDTIPNAANVSNKTLLGQ